MLFKEEGNKKEIFVQLDQYSYNERTVVESSIDRKARGEQTNERELFIRFLEKNIRHGKLLFLGW